MALHTKKLYFQRNGVTESVDLYNSQSDTGSPAMVLRDGTTNVYAGLVPTTSPDASNLRVMTGGQTLAIAKQMMISPWQWAVKAGGSSVDQGYGIAIDSSGNCYVTGYFSNTATFGSTSLTSSGIRDIFVAKLNASGVWEWAVKAGAASSDMGYGIAVDSSGNCYVTGYFEGTATFGSTTLTGGYQEIFVAKLNTSGVWQWAVKAGGGGSDYGRGIAIDSSGNCYVTGYFAGTATFGSTSLTSSGNNDIFVAKLDTSGVWQWAVKAGGAASSGDYGRAIAADSSGNCYVTGYFSGTATFGSTSLTAASSDIFVAKLNTSGVWQWAVKAGGVSADYGQGIAIDSSGNCYVTGYFAGTATFGSTSLTSSGNNDIFVAKLGY